MDKTQKKVRFKELDLHRWAKVMLVTLWCYQLKLGDTFTYVVDEIFIDVIVERWRMSQICLQNIASQTAVTNKDVATEAWMNKNNLKTSFLWGFKNLLILIKCRFWPSNYFHKIDTKSFRRSSSAELVNVKDEYQDGQDVLRRPDMG